jgi:hypothetical protein
MLNYKDIANVHLNLEKCKGILGVKPYKNVHFPLRFNQYSRNEMTNTLLLFKKYVCIFPVSS